MFVYRVLNTKSWALYGNNGESEIEGIIMQELESDLRGWVSDCLVVDDASIKDSAHETDSARQVLSGLHKCFQDYTSGESERETEGKRLKDRICIGEL